MRLKGWRWGVAALAQSTREGTARQGACTSAPRHSGKRGRSCSEPPGPSSTLTTPINRNDSLIRHIGLNPRT